MNSVISAFKAKKYNVTPATTTTNAMSTADNSKSATQGSLEPKPNAIIGITLDNDRVTKQKALAQDNGYHYLRQIREIETANKLLSSVVVTPDDVSESSNNINFRPVKNFDESRANTLPDHYASTIVNPFSKSAQSDLNMNGKEVSIDANVMSTVAPLSENGNISLNEAMPAVPCSADTSSPEAWAFLDDDDSLDSLAACNNSSSSSEHSNNTVVQSLSVATTNMAHNTLRKTQSSPVKGFISDLSGKSNGSPFSEFSNAYTDETTSISNDLNTPELAGSPIIGELEDKKNTDILNSTLFTLPNNKPKNMKSTPNPATSSTVSTKQKRYSKARAILNRTSIPSVHGRPSLSILPMMGINGPDPPKRISTHQRNLSLDFRSMGILLPPISQVTNNHTQHHRNRSLDSALQRIPEVEVSSPNADNENTFCSPSSILNTNMCSKIVTTAATVTAALSLATISPALMSETTEILESNIKILPSSHSTAEHIPSAIDQNYPLANSRSNLDEPSLKGARNSANIHISAKSNTTTPSTKIISKILSINKKREDLTSLGSDDSGIICGSESDQISLSRIRNSHDSLDLVEMDATGDAEVECIDIMETESMNEDYNTIQSDIGCYSSYDPKCGDGRTVLPLHKLNIPQRIKDHHMILKKPQIQHFKKVGDTNINRLPNISQAALEMELNKVHVAIKHVSNSINQKQSVSVAASSTADLDTSPTKIAATTLPIDSPTPTESTKNDQVLFKNFFGATKNAIFRTAQSIIENHEKKSAAKQKNNDQQQDGNCVAVGNYWGSGPFNALEHSKSPTDITRKKEFFGLLTSNSKKINSNVSHVIGNTSIVPTELSSGHSKSSINTATSTAAIKCKEGTLNLRLPRVENDITEHTLAKSSSISALHKLKVPVPGVVKFFISEHAPVSGAPKKNERPSGLLRFFESPVFNIHFAVHYLFYSKEPGVLSFIGNKIFSFPDHEVDLYMPQLIVMYIQMDELAEVLDPYLTIRCRKSVDFSLKCLWLLEAFNYQADSLGNTSGTRKSKLALLKEIISKKEQKLQAKSDLRFIIDATNPVANLPKKTHCRSQSDATVLLTDPLSSHTLNIAHRMHQQASYVTVPTSTKLCLGDLTSGRAFDNGCTCFETVRGQVNGLLGQKTFCYCGAPKAAPQKEFMKALINVGKNLTSLLSKAEKTSALRMFLNLINKNLPGRVWLPLYSDIPHHVVRITEEKTAVLNSKDKTPYIIYVEVVEVADIYTSPLIPKMMPSLRHTKSEEHLEGTCLNDPRCSQISTCSSAHHGSGYRRKKICESHVDNNASDTATHNCCSASALAINDLQLNENDVWSQEDDEITAQYLNMHKISDRDTISQMSLDSCDSKDQGLPVVFNIGDVRTRHCNNLSCENTKSFSNDPEDPSAAALKEPWHKKEKLIRESSPYGHLSNWRLLSAIVKCGDDLRQELMATQLLQMFKIIWQEEQVDLWVRPYKIICLSNDSGLIEPILNTVSLHQIKKNSNKSLRDYFVDEYGLPISENFQRAQKNFVQSCAAYCLISYLLQVKDRHNGNILFHSDGHIIHIDFGFILSISPKNLGFEQSPFKLTPEFVDVMGGTDSEHWREFNRLLLIGMMSARKHMDRIINFVEIMRSNAQLPCFKNGCSGTVQNLRKRFHMNLTEQEMERKVEQLVQDSLKSLSTKLYDGYQYYTNGIL